MVPTDCLEAVDGFVSVAHLLTTGTGGELAFLLLLLALAPATLGLLEAVLGGGRTGGTAGPFLCARGGRPPPAVAEEEVFAEPAVAGFGDLWPTGELDSLLTFLTVELPVEEAFMEAGRPCELVFRTAVAL